MLFQKLKKKMQLWVGYIQVLCRSNYAVEDFPKVCYDVIIFFSLLAIDKVLSERTFQLQVLLWNVPIIDEKVLLIDDDHTQQNVS